MNVFAFVGIASGFFSLGLFLGVTRDDSRWYRGLWEREREAHRFWFEEALRRGDELLAIAKGTKKHR